MSTPVNRVELLQALESVEPGRTKGTVSVEQSDAFCFRKGRVYTYDGDVFCKAKTPLPVDMRVAVQGNPLIETIRAIQTDKIDVGVEDNNFIIYTKGKKDEIRIRSERKIVLPYHEVEQPESWRPLPQPFSEGIGMVAECAGRDEEKFIFTCIHITEKFVEANDGFTFGRWRMKTGATRHHLVDAKSMALIAKRGPTKIGETKNWLFFRSGASLSMGIRRHSPKDNNGELLERLNGLAKQSGTPVTFPKRLVPATTLAEIFSSEMKDNNLLKIYLRPGKVRVESEGKSGGTIHRGTPQYRGPAVSFLLGPEMLKSLVEKHPAVEIGEGKIMVNGGKWYFATCANAIKAKENGDG